MEAGMVIRCAWLVGFVWGLSVPAFALDLYVDVESRGGRCDDGLSRGAVSEAAPWCTLGAAAEQVQPGDTVRVRGGTYADVASCRLCNDNSVLQVVTSGTADAPIRFTAYGDGEVILDGSGGATHGVYLGVTYDGSQAPRYVEVEGMTIRDLPGNCVAVKSTSDVTFRDLEVTGCVRGAVEFHETTRATLEYSRVYDHPMDGFTSAVDLYLCKDGNVVRGNRIWGNTDEDPHESEGHGITMDYCEADGGALIENNVIYGNEGWCMVIYVSDGGTIRNNTCVGNGVGRADTGLLLRRSLGSRGLRALPFAIPCGRLLRGARWERCEPGDVGGPMAHPGQGDPHPARGRHGSDPRGHVPRAPLAQVFRQ
jgi:parallel beta-helix repeat protein